MEMHWQIDQRELEEYYDNYLDRPSVASIKTYYGGFKNPNLSYLVKKYGKIMYKEELKDLQNVYTATLIKAEENLEDTLPELVSLMERFIAEYKQIEAISEKLEVLVAKNSIQSQKEDRDE